MSEKVKSRKAGRQRLHARVRRKVSGSSERLRFSVCFTGQHIYAQLIDDIAQKTVVSVATTEKELSGKKILPNIEGAVQVGKLLAERAISKKIDTVVFDRGGFRYTGKIKALADAAREAGLKF
ncbi:MAG: 50S ribosomal protein L18 [Candidatus Methylacidiphilales bacterium]